ncbi:MBL fold metallo-hydrolase [Heliophilum fasciatum]|uniref:Phosphoribosyl 1,2-cyclic phosphodiesterase n=1 Tax=Heliophilum fasciatum TaxID=35700 RepID=A0A4R2RBQ4_9FIRM|nr:MBL fold metallo-hydrolase [Heliophilum fasciatum]MCW2279351.1 phosphoribosyl 1,2-cyclic phosphodiesterase [Heliophilum fasciatum]TCP60782.1 phosphoribosyl 1,2-cyclic phosphodiesterase [Heliophilum fasciatum]
MRYTTLASGSNGNCTYVEGNDTRLLIDAGLTAKQLERNMETLGIDPGSMDAIVVTHEHIDHVRGVGVLARRYGLPIYASAGTWGAMASIIGKIKPEQIKTLELEMFLEIRGLKLEIFPTPHDTSGSIGLTVSDGRRRMGLATDSGYVTRGMGRRLLGCDAIILEANHDVRMLQEGPYPYALKRRVAGQQGHLSNRAAGEALVKFCEQGTRQVLLAHLSETNNRPELALETVATCLRDGGFAVALTLTNDRCGDAIALSVAPRYDAHPLVAV